MCNVCNNKKEMVNFYGNQPWEFTKIKCSCCGGPTFVGNPEEGYRIKEEVLSYEKWLKSDSDDFEGEPDYWFPNNQGLGTPDEVLKYIEYDEKYSMYYEKASRVRGFKPLSKEKWFELLNQRSF